MESSAPTPLLDQFRRGEAPLDLKLLAARGVLAPRAHEQLELLILLVEDAEAEVAAAAEATLQSISPQALGAFLARTDVPAGVRSFFDGRGTPIVASAPSPTDAPLVDVAPEPEPPPANEDTQSTLIRLTSMTVAQRIGRAMKGTREERSILIRDSNKLVSTAVLSSPKVTESEIETIAKMGSVSEEIIRTIAKTRAWMKRYGIVASLARNPKTPVAISMHLLSRLNDKDLRGISTDRNVPEALRIAARQKIVLNK
jgi:hypothetical protein